VLSFLNPLLAWGVAGITAPILIHLLLRQRPKPRPWAAMRWLLAAMQAAQRRYKLTNLLLLLLRCLALALLAMALARPSLAGLGVGGRLVLVVDITASMGQLGGSGGALQAAKRALDQATLDHDRVLLITVGEEVRQRSDGSAEQAKAALRNLQTVPIPGGLDRAAREEHVDALLSWSSDDSDVLLISDFRQDTGEQLMAVLDEKVHSIARWRVGSSQENALVTGIHGLGDLLPGQTGELLLKLQGDCEQALVAVDGGLDVPVPLVTSGGLVRLGLPPMDAGQHHVHIRLDEPGLVYDNRVELPVSVRGNVGAVVLAQEPSRLGTALMADTLRLDARMIEPSELSSLLLPERGLVALRGPIGEPEKLAAWTRQGGVLWARLDDLETHDALAALAPTLQRREELRPGGRLQTGQSDLDPSLSKDSVDEVPVVTLPENAEVLLAAGDAPMVVASPAGSGWLVVELLSIEAQTQLVDRGAFPLWVRRSVRRLAARLDEPQVIEAGRPAPADLHLRRDGRERQIAADEPLLLGPGLWQQSERSAGKRPVLVLGNRDEGRLYALPVEGASTELSDALPQQRGRDWGMPLLAAMLLVLICEGLLAAWAGRTYGG